MTETCSREVPGLGKEMATPNVLLSGSPVVGGTEKLTALDGNRTSILCLPDRCSSQFIYKKSTISVARLVRKKAATK